MKRLMLILSCLLLSVGMVVAQTKQASGVVLDDTGSEIIGAAIIVKGTSTGTITDADGKFTLNVPEGRDVLVISYVGMKSQEVKAAQNLQIVLQSTTDLDEVVVTAMGVARDKKALGYATQNVTAEKLVQAGNPDLMGSLQGKIAGVEITPSSGMPGASSQFKIRGARSFTGDNTPLYVVDGMPIASTSDLTTNDKNNGSVSGTDYANRAIDINPNDIESVEILKGQAAAALYGIRASNGVVLITTKSGKGLAKGKPRIEISSGVSFDKISRYPKLQKIYAQGSDGEYSPTASTSWGPKISELPNDPSYGGNTDNDYTLEFGKQPGKYYVPQRARAGIDPWATPGTYDNVKEFFTTGVTWNNSFSLSQALDKSHYTVSMAMTNQDGIVPNTGMDRYNAKVGAETKLTSQITTGFVGNYVKTEIQKAPGANDGLVATVFAAPASYDLAGIPNHYDSNPYRQNNYRGGSFVNPYWFVNNNDFSEETSRFYGNAYANFKSNLNSTDKKLDIRYQIGTDAYVTDYSDVWGYGMKGSANNGEAALYHYSIVNFNSLLTAHFDWSINEDWRLDIVGGNEIIHRSSIYTNTEASSFTFAGWNNIGNATAITLAVHEQNSRRTVGFFGSATASYKNMLYLGVTGRNDIVSSMPRGSRSFFYPSLTGSFVLTELDQLKNNDVLDFAKVRLAYAEVGQASDEYETLFYTTPVFGGGFYSGTPLSYPIGGIKAFSPYSRVFDPALKPQNTRSYEAGFDLTFLKGLLDVSYTYTRQNVKDQIFPVPLAGSTGIEEMVTNAGSVHTNSHEISLNINPIKSRLVDWSVGLNWTKIDNYVDELAPGVESISLGGFVTPQVRASVGNKFPVIYGSDFARDDQGRILVGDDGLPYAGEDAVIGKVSPDFNLGLNTSLRIEKLILSAVFDWKSGGQMYHGTNGLLDFYGVSQKSADSRTNGVIFDGWKKDGTKNDVKIEGTDVEGYYNALNGIDASSVYDNSFIKLRELSASYNVFKNSIVDVTVSAFLRNVIIWSELDNFDPEASQANDNMAGAFERFSLPQTTSFGFGLNVKF